MIEKEDVASGLVELIGLRGIAELVVSAAADRQYSTYDILLTLLTELCFLQIQTCSVCFYQSNKEMIIHN